MSGIARWEPDSRPLRVCERFNRVGWWQFFCLYSPPTIRRGWGWDIFPTSALPSIRREECRIPDVNTNKDGAASCSGMPRKCVFRKTGAVEQLRKKEKRERVYQHCHDKTKKDGYWRLRIRHSQSQSGGHAVWTGRTYRQSATRIVLEDGPAECLYLLFPYGGAPA